jgi:hypothetical protein
MFTGLFGVREGIEERGYVSVPKFTRKKTVLAKEQLGTLIPFLLWSPLGVGLNVGQSASSESRFLPVVLTFTPPSYRCGALLCRHRCVHLDAGTSH